MADFETNLEIRELSLNEIDQVDGGRLSEPMQSYIDGAAAMAGGGAMGYAAVVGAGIGLGAVGVGALAIGGAGLAAYGLYEVVSAQ